MEISTDLPTDNLRLTTYDSNDQEYIEIVGAREHNLKNISLSIPRNKLVVITGLSGSGKSSLAFDTIYAEGQRRYIETLSAYARQFLGGMERPDVDKIEGLSPVISIEQKTVGRNPRSTVGTITEIYDFLRLFFARTGEAFSYVTGEKMIRFSEQQIIELLNTKYAGQRISLFAPVVKGRKGHYRELFEQLRKSGFSKVRIDGEIKDLRAGLHADRYAIHDIEVLIDRIDVPNNEETRDKGEEIKAVGSRSRLSESVGLAMKQGKGMVMVIAETGDVPIVQHFSRFLVCPTSGISYDEPAPNLFSFNSPYGACPKCSGLGEISQLDEKKIIPDMHKSINDGAIVPVGKRKDNWIFHQLEAIGERHGFTLDTPVNKVPEAALHAILYGTDEILKVRENFHSSGHSFSMNFEGIINFIEKQSRESDIPGISEWASGFMNRVVCPECKGARLKKESLYFKIDDKNIAELANMDIGVLKEWIYELANGNKLSAKNQIIAKDIMKELKTRIQFLLDVGIDYLTLNRSAKTLSGGEGQRIRLATQIGSGLVGVLYILDEPSIGLHQRDNHKLIGALQQLRDLGNSVIVVEHDKDMMLSSDWIIDIGPGTGLHGGSVVAEGDARSFESIQKSIGTKKENKANSSKLLALSSSLTADFLSGRKLIEVPKTRRKGNGKELILKGASGHNLKNVTVSFPLGKLICVTGVSGSGKSSLINQTLYPIISKHLYKSEATPLPYSSIQGIQYIDKIIEIDQSPIGRTPRSNPATYVNLFADIRNLYSILPESKIRGYLPGRFSFNVKGGRCETCKGAGLRKIEMNFLPDVYVQCETCGGKRYNRETLEVRFKGKSINDVLNLTVEQAVEFFSEIPFINQKITTLNQIGLGYITLGQSSTTLSGGEAQRVKLATELSKRHTGNTLYILDEPTTGLHFEDIRMLLDVLNKLVDYGNTVLVIEHNLDVIKIADHVIDMGPEGGQRGGKVIAEGAPEVIVKNKKSITAEYLKAEL